MSNTAQARKGWERPLNCHLGHGRKWTKEAERITAATEANTAITQSGGGKCELENAPPQGSVPTSQRPILKAQNEEDRAFRLSLWGACSPRDSAPFYR